LEHKIDEDKLEDMPMGTRASRGAAVLIVVLLIASAILMLHPLAAADRASRLDTATASAGTGGYVFDVAVLGTVTGTSFFVPTNANVTLINTHNAALRYYLNYSDGYSIKGIPSGSLVPGYYEVSVSAPGYFTAKLPVPVEFNDTENVTTPVVVIWKIASPNTYLTVFVNGPGHASGIKNAQVALVETNVINSTFGEYNQTVATGFTNSSGNLTLEISNSYNYDVIVSLNNSNSTYTTYYGPSYVSVSGASLPASVSVTLPVAYDVGGIVKTSSGTLARNITAYMLSYASTNLPLQLRLFRAYVSAYFYNFFVPAGNYVLAINATALASYITNVTVTGPQTLNVVLQPKISDGTPVSNTTVTYATGTPNWNYLNISYYQSLDAGTPIIGLPYSSVPSVAMQLAIDFNNGYPEINASTLTSASSAINLLGPEYTTTYGLLSVNSSYYLGEQYTTSLSNVLIGSVVRTSHYYLNITDSYRSQSVLPSNGSAYSVILNAGYNTTEMQYVYTIEWPQGFQLSSSSSTGPYGPVTVKGYVVTTVYSTSTGYGYATVSLNVQVGKIPVVKAAVVTGVHSFAYTKNGKVLYYIVRAGALINYTAQGSYDPSGGPLYYSWHWSNTSYLPSTYTNTSQTVVNHTYYNYTTPGVYENITLTATSVTGQKASTYILVRVANDTTLKAVITGVSPKIVNGRIYAGQEQTITVNGLASKASISPGDDQGIIISYNFSWGDGPKNYTVISYTSSNLNATHSYYKAGNYTLNLTVTDEVGFQATTSITVQVNKTLKPIVSFVVYNYKWKAADGSVQENTTVHFNASATHDPNFPVSDLLFEWNFGDIHNTTNATTRGNMTYSKYLNLTGVAGENVTHIYTYITTKPITVNLTVVDPAGNKAWYTYNLTVTSEPRPDLRIINITFSPKVFTQGSAGKIKVTLINIGNANATLPKVVLKAVSAVSGATITIGTITTFYNATNKTQVTTILPNETVYGTITWSPPSFGNFTIQATTYAALQLQSSVNTATEPLSINQSQLQVYAFYIGLVVIIVAIILVIALRRRMPRRRGYEKGQPPKKK
jgi:hypothetical protein